RARSTSKRSSPQPFCRGTSRQRRQRIISFSTSWGEDGLSSARSSRSTTDDFSVGVNCSFEVDGAVATAHETNERLKSYIDASQPRERLCAARWFDTIQHTRAREALLRGGGAAPSGPRSARGGRK